MELIINHLSKKFGKKIILDQADFTFEKGKIYVLLGRNGSGKTTFFNCINGDLALDSGDITLSSEENTRPVSFEDISYVISTPTVPSFLTGREFLSFFMSINNKKIHFDKTADQYLEMVGIKEEDRDTLLRDYSHGMKTKIQLLLSLINDTPVLLLDEPLTALDVVAAEEMKDLLKKAKDGRIVIFSTHIMELALTLADEIVLLHNHKLTSLPTEEADNEERRQMILEALKEEENA